jgi:hypothetical protein
MNKKRIGYTAVLAPVLVPFLKLRPPENGTFMSTLRQRNNHTCKEVRDIAVVRSREAPGVMTPATEEDCKLGDVWDISSSPIVVTAWKQGRIHSIDSRTNSSAGYSSFRREPLKIAFINASSYEELLLCWVSSSIIDDSDKTSRASNEADGIDNGGQAQNARQNIPKLYHYYCIPPKGRHQENTFSGDAFALFVNSKQSSDDKQNIDETTTLQEKEHLRIVAAYRPLLLAPATEITELNKSAVRHCVTVSPPNNCPGLPEFGERILNLVRCRQCCCSRKRQRQIICMNNGSDSDARREEAWKVNVTHEIISPTTPFDSTSKQYGKLKCGPWTLRCEPGWDACHSKCRDIFFNDLNEATRRLPRQAKEQLSSSTILWLNKSQKYGLCKEDPVEGKGACFHPDVEWLIENGERAGKHGCVEFYSCEDYLRDRHLWGA